MMPASRAHWIPHFSTGSRQQKHSPRMCHCSRRKPRRSLRLRRQSSLSTCSQLTTHSSGANQPRRTTNSLLSFKPQYSARPSRALQRTINGVHENVSTRMSTVGRPFKLVASRSAHLQRSSPRHRLLGVRQKLPYPRPSLVLRVSPRPSVHPRPGFLTPSKSILEVSRLRLPVLPPHATISTTMLLRITHHHFRR